VGLLSQAALAPSPQIVGQTIVMFHRFHGRRFGKVGIVATELVYIAAVVFKFPTNQYLGCPYVYRKGILNYFF